MQRGFAKLLFFCGERIDSINEDEENTLVDKLPTLPPEMWLEIMRWVYIEYVPKKTSSLRSAELELRFEGDEKDRVEQYKEYKQLYKTFDSEVILVRL